MRNRLQEDRQQKRNEMKYSFQTNSMDRQRKSLGLFGSVYNFLFGRNKQLQTIQEEQDDNNEFNLSQTSLSLKDEQNIKPPIQTKSYGSHSNKQGRSKTLGGRYSPQKFHSIKCQQQQDIQRVNKIRLRCHQNLVEDYNIGRKQNNKQFRIKDFSSIQIAKCYYKHHPYVINDQDSFPLKIDSSRVQINEVEERMKNPMNYIQQQRWMQQKNNDTEQEKESTYPLHVAQRERQIIIDSEKLIKEAEDQLNKHSQSKSQRELSEKIESKNRSKVQRLLAPTILDHTSEPSKSSSPEKYQNLSQTSNITNPILQVIDEQTESREETPKKINQIKQYIPDIVKLNLNDNQLQVPGEINPKQSKSKVEFLKQQQADFPNSSKQKTPQSTTKEIIEYDKKKLEENYLDIQNPLNQSRVIEQKEEIILQFEPDLSAQQKYDLELQNTKSLQQTNDSQGEIRRIEPVLCNSKIINSHNVDELQIPQNEQQKLQQQQQQQSFNPFLQAQNQQPTISLPWMTSNPIVAPLLNPNNFRQTQLPFQQTQQYPQQVDNSRMRPSNTTQNQVRIQNPIIQSQQQNKNNNMFPWSTQLPQLQMQQQQPQPFQQYPSFNAEQPQPHLSQMSQQSQMSFGGPNTSRINPFISGTSGVSALSQNLEQAAQLFTSQTAAPSQNVQQVDLFRPQQTTQSQQPNQSYDQQKRLQTLRGNMNAQQRI